MKKFLFTLSVIVSASFLLACGSGKAENTEETIENASLTNGTVVIGAAADGYPQTYMEEGELTGYSIEVAEAVFEEAGYDVQWEIADWNGLLAALATGKIDTMGNFAYTEERAETYHFTEPYFYTRTGLAVAEGDTSVTSVEDLQGETVVNILGSNYGKTLNTALPKNYLEIQTLLNLPIGVQMVTSGKTAAIVQGYETLLAQVKDRGLPLRVLDETFEERAAAFPFRKVEEYQPVIEDVNEAIQILSENGTIEKISVKWFGRDITVSDET